MVDHREHGLIDLLQSNEKGGESDVIETDLRTLFRIGDKLTSKGENTLVRLGFVLTSEGINRLSDIKHMRIGGVRRERLRVRLCKARRVPARATAAVD